jgi:serine/threonine-protein kinase
MLSDPGRMLGKYQLIAEIARGGMGVVYLAMVQGPGGFNKLVVVKELKPELVEEPAFLTMFLDEARLAARLSHPNIVQTNEVGNDGDRYFMAMDYLDGRGLDQIRRRSKVAGFGLSVPMHLRVVCDMLTGLDYAHKMTDFDGSPLNIVHRDVSPQNVFVTFDGQVKLLDFGIAKASDSMYETHAGVVKGKVSYMSPEQGRGWKVDARADVFSAGVMLWEALTGKRMREGKNDQEKLWALVSNETPRASEIKPWVPPELDEICARAMAWNRDERYPSAGAMQQDLERYLISTGMNVTAREVGSCVSELFREDRANTNSVIEAHIARARGGGREKLPIIDVASRAVGSPTPSGERAMTRPPFDPELMTSPGTPSARSGEVSAPVASEQRKAEGRDLRPVIITAIAGVAVGVIVILLVARLTRDPGAVSRADTPAAPPASALPVAPQAPAPAPPPAPTPPPKPAMIDVQFRVSPTTATVSIDGIVVDGNPFAKQFPVDDETHQFRASAPGYVTKQVAQKFNANVTLDLSLERLPAPPPPPPSPPPRTVTRPKAPEVHKPEPTRPAEPAQAAPSPTPAQPAAEVPRGEDGKEIKPEGGSKPRRTIDPNNPYGGGQRP